jgi:hypothetical protein
MKHQPAAVHRTRLAALWLSVAPAVALAGTLAYHPARPASVKVLVDECDVALQNVASGTMKWPHCAGD